MLNSFEFSGLWWLPENSETKIYGVLSYESGRRVVLSLEGSFGEKPGEDTFYEVILGDSYGKKITLKNCLQSNLEVTYLENSKKYVRSKFVVSTFYVGYHFVKREDIKFTRLSVRYSQLEEWLGKKPFNFEESKNKEGLLELTLRFTMPNVEEIVLDKFQISIGYGFSTGMGDWGRPKFESNAWISVNVMDEMYIEDFFQIIYHIRNFLSLATGNRISILSIHGENKKIEDCKSIQIFYREKFTDEGLFSFPFFPIQYKSISERSEFYFQNWFNVIRDLEPVYDLFFGTVYNPHLYPNHEFLSLAQALESYHSMKFDNHIMPQSLFRELSSQILETISIISHEYQQLFVPKVKHEMNRKSLRTKLKDLFEKYGNLFAPFIENKDKFIGKIVDTRNYYTHYPHELKERAAKVEELPFLSQNLRFILIVILLKETGFGDDIISQALGKYMRSRIRRIV